MNRRSFLRIAGLSLGAGALYQVAPLAAAADRRVARANGEAVSPFTFVQMSDTHVGFRGPPDPLGTKAFERAVETVNRLRPRPDLILFTGDLTHDSEDQGERVARMKTFREIAGRLRVRTVKMVPGEHDAGIDQGALYRETFGETSYSFDHRGVHFVALDNVSRARPEVGAERIAWLERDLARFPKTAPIVVFTHRPLFDLKPEWEWFTSDGDAVLNVLSRHEHVTVLYGHIHREDEHEAGGIRHWAARSLVFAFPDPEKVADKKPVPFDPVHPFRNLGIRVVSAPGRAAGGAGLGKDEVELTRQEHSGTEGMVQLVKASTL